MTGLITTADGKVLISGNQSSDNAMWVARIDNSSGTYALDTTFASGDLVQGIMQFNGHASPTVTSRYLAPIAIYGDGQITMVGTEDNGINNPYMSRAYDNPYTSQEPTYLGAKAAGTIDHTFGVGIEPNYAENGIVFLATAPDSNADQVARAVVVQDGNDNGLVVAIDGGCSLINGGNTNCIYLNIFDVDGLLNSSFNPNATSPLAPGQALVLGEFDNQYVNDILTFTAQDGFSRAILSGYATQTTPSLTGSLLMQYILNPSNPQLDLNFGGLNGNIRGLAFGDGKQLNTVGLQSTGRIIAGGLDQSNQGLLLGYTPAGNLDQSFGQGGTFVQGASGIYASVIDTQDRLVIAYNVSGTLTIARILADGSGLDTSFGIHGIVTTTITTVINNSNLRIAIDGSGNIVVATVETGGTTFKIARYASDNGDLLTAVNTIGSTMSLTNFTITKMLIDSNGAVIVIGYDQSSQNKIVVARLVYASTEYILDTTFNASAGFIKYGVDTISTQHSTGGSIHPEGRIIVAGSRL